MYMIIYKLLLFILLIDFSALNLYLPKVRTCPRSAAERTAVQTVWTGPKTETKRGPFLPRHHVWNAMHAPTTTPPCIHHRH